jgi:transposase
MPRPRAAMRRIREALRLAFEVGLTASQVSIAMGLPRTTVRRYLERAASSDLKWPLPAEIDDRQLEQLLFGRPAPPPRGGQQPLPDWAAVYRELRRPHVTLQLLWMEYKERFPDGFQYTWFTEHYRAWAHQLDVVLRQEHRAGEKLFVDFAGQTIPIANPKTGEITQAQFFVAVLGASNYTYVEATPSQELPHWIAAHVRAFEYFGGVPQVVVPDNLKVGVTRGHRYEPELNRTYLECAAHYRCAIIPARPRKPRDKAKVEAGVLVAERWILASIRNLKFFSVAEANEAIAERLEWLNDRPFTKPPGSRRSLFESLDRPALQPLPDRPYEFATWKMATASIDYHVEVDRHRYSVPYQLVGQRCDVRIAALTVEIFHRGRRVASHVRGRLPGGFTTDPAHMPESHRRHLEWTPGRLVRWAQETGPATAQVVEGILRSRPHPEQGFRSCLGIFRLGRTYGADRLEAACTRALAIQALSYRSIQSILKNGLDRQPLPAPAEERPHREHANLRGAAYYQ